ncbi:AcrR family transcriptional regulator [Desulfosarcina widdelii]|uniref:AcrR family transcriptional regulator n=1 Tax=Desulfosarcina widdelii TaxID=947919 RepID=A0A5K7Z3F0_9BACT|nr:TetR/AcrR family transcriptional regulator [Desulfosarcina widdelii]BBO74789.1 AcrR family transcriptional regulator [Desulfosarcina widdelii]
MGLKERREREKEARKGQILTAARNLLFKKGIQATSINQIARKAELGVGTIYFYYQSKEEIFYWLQEEGLDILFKTIDAIGGEDFPPDEKLRRTGSAYLEFSNEHKDYFDIINYFLATPTVILGAEMKQRIDRKGSRILELIEQFVHAGIKDGRFRSVDSKKWAVMFWGALHGLTQFKKLEDTVLEGEEHHRIFHYAVEQLIEGLKTTTV